MRENLIFHQLSSTALYMLDKNIMSSWISLPRKNVAHDYIRLFKKCLQQREMSQESLAESIKSNIRKTNTL